NPASKLGVREPLDPQEKTEAPIPIPSYYGFQTSDYKYVEYLDASGKFSDRELYAVWDTFELNNLASQIDPAFSEALKAHTASLLNCKGEGCRSAEAVAPPALPRIHSSTNTALSIDDQPGDKRFLVQVSYNTSQGGGLHGDGRAVTLSSVGMAHGGAF